MPSVASIFRRVSTLEPHDAEPKAATEANTSPTHLMLPVVIYGAIMPPFDPMEQSFDAKGPSIEGLRIKASCAQSIEHVLCPFLPAKLQNHLYDRGPSRRAAESALVGDFHYVAVELAN